MSDIVERLRGLADCDARAGEPLGKCMREAADEIAGLREQLDSATIIGNRLIIENVQLKAEIGRLRTGISKDEGRAGRDGLWPAGNNRDSD